MQENNQSNNTPEVTPVNDTPVTPSTDVVTETEVTTPAEVVEAKVEEVPVEKSTEVATTEATPVSDNATELTTGDTEASGSNAKKQMLIQYGVATFIVLLMGAGLAYALEQQGRINTGIFDKVKEIVSPSPIAASVNGKKITVAQYEKNLTQLQNAAAQQGADVANQSVIDEIKKQAIDVLINTELLKQEAKKSGAVVTAEEIDARYQEIVDSLGGEDKLIAKMNELAITAESLRQDIEGEILIQGHLQKAVDTTKVEVTDEDLKTAYAEITKGGSGQVPSLADIKSQLAEELKFTKEQELVNEYITKLRESAEIEVLI